MKPLGLMLGKVVLPAIPGLRRNTKRYSLVIHKGMTTWRTHSWAFFLMAHGLHSLQQLGWLLEGFTCFLLIDKVQEREKDNASAHWGLWGLEVVRVVHIFTFPLWSENSLACLASLHFLKVFFYFSSSQFFHFIMKPLTLCSKLWFLSLDLVFFFSSSNGFSYHKPKVY